MRTWELVRRAAAGAARVIGSRSATTAHRAPSPTRSRPTSPTGAGAAGAPAYRGDFTGRATISYAPLADGRADPGEVVWAWVPYEEDATQGKDRPVLVIAEDGDDLLGLMLTSKDHDERPDADRWFDIGTGGWDRQGRPSEVRLDRVLRLAPSAVRREGAALDRARFDAVTAAASRVLGW